MTRWNTKNRHKFLLQYHIIFVCKYRKKLFLSKNISDDIKKLSYDICLKHNIVIRYIYKYSKYLNRYFWRERTFWSDGYFVSTIGNVSEERLHVYIENQG